MSDYFFALTHSARVMDFARASLHALQRRYANPKRLAAPPPLATLPPEANPHYTGNITLWVWNPATESQPRFLELIRKPYKAQHAILDGDELVVCGTCHLDIFPVCGDKELPKRTITHPWFAGGHTVALDERGHYVVSCSGPDALLVFRRDGTLERAWRVPADIYGRNYDLQADDDLRQHYIHNDLQLAHVNCGEPTPRGLLCTSLIPGAIGLFDPQGRYREILRGYVGCHSARWDRVTDTLYFCDSCNGNVIEIDWEGRILHRTKFASSWLQDAQKFDFGRILAGLSDQNVFTLWDTSLHQPVWTISGEGYGQTSQFCSWARLSAGLTQALRAQVANRGTSSTVPPPRQPASATPGAQHALPTYLRAALSAWLKTPANHEREKKMRATPHANVFSDGQWLQMLAFAQHFKPDIVLELGNKSGRLAACAADICAATLAQHFATHLDPDWPSSPLSEAPAPVSVSTQRTMVGTDPTVVLDNLAPAGRVMILCGNLDATLSNLLLSHLLPALQTKSHVVILPAITDGRLHPRLPYADSGKSYWVLGDVIGLKSAEDSILPLVDFVSRNELTLFSADLGLQQIRCEEPELYQALVVMHGGEAFSGSHWRWFTLNERQPPFVFPNQD